MKLVTADNVGDAGHENRRERKQKISPAISVHGRTAEVDDRHKPGIHALNKQRNHAGNGADSRKNAIGVGKGKACGMQNGQNKIGNIGAKGNQETGHGIEFLASCLNGGAVLASHVPRDGVQQEQIKDNRADTDADCQRRGSDRCGKQGKYGAE